VRRRFIVCYDVSDPKRLRTIYQKLLGFGDPVQYSVFLCELSDREKFLMFDVISGVIHHREDRVMIVNVGPAEGRGREAIEFLGRSIPPDERPVAVIV